MRILRRQIIFAYLFSIVLCQNDIYRSVDEVQDEWTSYTSFQKEEMVSLNDFNELMTKTPAPITTGGIKYLTAE